MVEHQSQWLGTVLLEPKITHWMFASMALLATAAVIGLLFFTSYTRKARINGWLVPQQGLVRVFAPQAGVITQVHVKEGMEVKKGTLLLAVSTEMQSETVGGTRQEIVHRLMKRRNSARHAGGSESGNARTPSQNTARRRRISRQADGSEGGNARTRSQNTAPRRHISRPEDGFEGGKASTRKGAFAASDQLRILTRCK